jgi:multidrug efflux system membrane fusion protein
VLGLLGLCLLGFFAYRLRGQQPAGGAGGPGGAAAEARVVPVTVARAALGDLAIYLEGLGSVTPLYTVTIKSQVDGRLDRVFFTEGQTVHRRQLLAQIDPRPFAIQLQQAEAALARDAAQLRNAKLNYERQRMLREQRLVAQQAVDDQRTSADQFQATLAADQAQIDNAKLQLNYARIVSPITGVTGVRLVDPGNLIHASDPTGIVVITQLDPIAVLFTLPEDHEQQVAKALATGPVTVDAYGRDGTTKLAAGRLLMIDNEINQSTATIRLKATFPNPDRALWPNAFVKARLLLSTRRGQLLVPTTAVQRGPQGTFAYVVNPDQTVALRPIVVEVTQGDTTAIAGGIEPGALVVTEGQSQLRPGAKVAPHLLTMPPPAASARPPGSGPG